ncbi:MAG TPA: hypothetical protein VKZ18_27465 [Polyangia bacterium]|nr:hypothetical protein [Polyangia bacterium]
MSPLRALFSTEIFMPRGHEYLWTPKLLVLEGAASLVLAVGCLVLAVAVARRRRAGLPLPARRWTPLVVFLVLAAWTHLSDVWLIWAPLYWLDALVRCAAAIAVVAAAASLVTDHAHR